MPAEMHLPLFYIRQRFAMTRNRYELRAAAPDGSEGELVGLAQQQRMRLKERVVFYTDESRRRTVFSFGARKVIDLGSGYDVTDADGAALGYFRKDFGRSLLRSTFHLEGPGYVGSGRERSELVALVRRFLEVPFLPIHFDFATTTGEPLLSVERQATVRDRYTVRVPDERVDFRVAAALGVGLDALMSR